MTKSQIIVGKFLDTLKVDSIKDVKYVGKFFSYQRCVCGQPIKTAYKFTNMKNGLSCTVGKICLPYIISYLGWN